MLVGSPFLNRRGDDIAVFGPTSVVILHVVEAEQIFQHEPGMTRSLADATIGNGRFLGINTLLLEVNGLELVCRLEGAILLHGGAPWNALGAWNVAAALRGFGHAGRRNDLAG